MSFAGIHESSTDVRTESDVETAVRLVWASLWSDAALLYRRELRLDPAVSRMAVLVQRMVHADRSGVAFGMDPRGANENLAIVEAVPGPCRLLVDGAARPACRRSADRSRRCAPDSGAARRRSAFGPSHDCLTPRARSLSTRSSPAVAVFTRVSTKRIFPSTPT